MGFDYFPGVHVIRRRLTASVGRGSKKLLIPECGHRER